jgi:hypothetical protein
MNQLEPLPAPAALDQYFLEARARLLDLAAILDRIGRGEAAERAEADPRWGKIQRALAILAEPNNDRAERVQRIFSIEYDPNWAKPRPRF